MAMETERNCFVDTKIRRLIGRAIDRIVVETLPNRQGRVCGDVDYISCQFDSRLFCGIRRRSVASC
jgi:hypothetical protein